MRVIIAILLVVLLVIAGGVLVRTYTRDEIVLIADPRVLAVVIAENNDPMVDFKTERQIPFGPSPEIPNNTDYTKVRKKAYAMLLQAEALLPQGLHLCLYEGFRSLNLQKMLFDNRYSKIKQQHPSWTESQLFAETTKLVSPVINEDGTTNIPPHSTGGAVDVYLVDDEGLLIDMGMHPKDWVDDSDGSLSRTDTKIISAEAQKYRKIMSEALSSVGFVNYPTEYWHWSYGDRYWAYHKNMPQAIYGNE